MRAVTTIYHVYLCVIEQMSLVLFLISHGEVNTEYEIHGFQRSIPAC